jgi:four helix bundle protein
MGQTLRVLDAARQVRSEVNALLRTARPPLIYDQQLRASAGSISANIREAFGRRRGAERNQYFRVARSSAEETDEHLLANHEDGRLAASRYWSFHHRLVTIVKMLNRMMTATPQ